MGAFCASIVDDDGDTMQSNCESVFACMWDTNKNNHPTRITIRKCDNVSLTPLPHH